MGGMTIEQFISSLLLLGFKAMPDDRQPQTHDGETQARCLGFGEYRFDMERYELFQRPKILVCISPIPDPYIVSTYFGWGSKENQTFYDKHAEALAHIVPKVAMEKGNETRSE